LLRQEEIIEQVRAVCAADAELDAALMYGSFVLGEGDEFSDVEFWLFFADGALAGVDSREWVERIAPTLAWFTNEHGTEVAVFDDLVRGEFHFEEAARIGVVSQWYRGTTRSPDGVEVVLDRRGALASALAERPERGPDPLTYDEFSHLIEHFAERVWMGANVLRRGERARAFAVLGEVHRLLLQMARTVERRTGHWLTPQRLVEQELSAEALERLALCTSGLVPGELERAYFESWLWGRDLAFAIGEERMVEVPAALVARIDERIRAWFE
jgi:lincosamide nucleotidyltransferase